MVYKNSNQFPGGSCMGPGDSYLNHFVGIEITTVFAWEGQQISTSPKTNIRKDTQYPPLGKKLLKHVPQSLQRIIENHTRPGKTHNFPYSPAHCRSIAMHPAAAARSLPISKRATV